jgi:hypothetical protein
MRARDIGQVSGCWRGEFCRIDALFGERVANQIGKAFVDRNDLIGRAGQRPEQQKIFLVARQEHPFAFAAFDDGTRSHGVAVNTAFRFFMRRMQEKKSFCTEKFYAAKAMAEIR